ncbi:MAG: ABC transporter ATP-binding protein [Bacillota bacterium]
MYLEIKGLSFKYKNSERDIITDFSLNIEKGEVTAILGESGSGKSTILRLIAGLEVPDKGSIKIDNKTMVDINYFIPPEKRGVGVVFQDYALFPHMTVEKNIRFGLKLLNTNAIQNRIKEMLDLVNLKGLEKRYPYELSGGQQQRVALARSLAPNPSILLFDEPFSNLDTQLRHKIREDLKRIIKQVGITSIFVTHDQEDANVLADRKYIMDGI